jgi:hypothetical protein
LTHGNALELAGSAGAPEFLALSSADLQGTEAIARARFQLAVLGVEGLKK